MRVIALLFIVLCAVAAGWYVVTHPGLFTAPTVAPVTETVATSTESSMPTPQVSKVEWEFRLIEDGVGDPMTAPQSDIAVTFLLSSGEAKGPYRLGSFEGSCSEQPIEGVTVQGAQARALCWFAGAGTEFVVVQQDAFVHVLMRGVDEGTAEVAPVQQEYTEQLTVQLES
jgi:hypothetical protein